MGETMSLVVRKIVTPVEALSVFMPKSRNTDRPALGHDWNMVLIGLATFVISMTTVSRRA